MRLRKRTTVIIAASAMGVAATGGVAYSAVGGVDEPGRAGSVAVDEAVLPEDDAGEREALAGLATVTESGAADTATESVGGGQLLQAELQEDDGFVVWEVLVGAADGRVHEVTIDAGNATVLASEADEDLGRAGTVRLDPSRLPEDDAAEQAALADAATVDETAARQAAVESAGGVEAVFAELEEEAGYVVWDVIVRTSDYWFKGVTVDAGDGTVLGFHADGDEEESLDDD